MPKLTALARERISGVTVPPVASAFSSVRRKSRVGTAAGWKLAATKRRAEPPAVSVSGVAVSALVEKLTAEGRMQPAGLAAYEARREDRQGIYAYEQAETGALPPEYAAALAGDSRAGAFWALATASYRRQCIHWVLAAKQQVTRDRRLATLVADCAAGQLIAPMRYGTQPAWVARAQAALAQVPE